MDDYLSNLHEETNYLNTTVNFIKSELVTLTSTLAEQKTKLIEFRRDMWENTVHFVNDFDRLTEMNQYLTELNAKTLGFSNMQKHAETYKRILDSPYFARIDLADDESPDPEKIYIGLSNIMDRQTHHVYVYDWRAPISSLFYRFELGKGFYTAPIGTISCEILLKRQYKIQHSELKYFFDCSLTINDDLLQEVLSHNSSPQMRQIVETIQKEQDVVIRDTENELLMVQGVAGSGKTSIALHRIAFLLYHGLSSNLNSTNFLIISPNAIFSKYISTVLPELGEENVKQTTFETIALQHFDGKFIPEERNSQLEGLIFGQASKATTLKRQAIDFKGSRTFVQVLERFLRHYARHMIPFQDIYYNGAIIMTRQQLKNRFLKNTVGIPMAKQLQRVANMVLDKVHPLQKQRLTRLEAIVQKSEGHELEVKSFSRLLALKDAKRFEQRLQQFTTVDYLDMYRALFANSELFNKLCLGLNLPENIAQIIAITHQALQQGHVAFEDCAPLLYLKLKVEGDGGFAEIKHVVIDEAQDYYPLHYEVFKLLFKQARYTVLGDVNQAIAKHADLSLYDEVEQILAKNRSFKLFLNTGYRSSYETNEFALRVLGVKQTLPLFERHEAKPVIVCRENSAALAQQIVADIADYLSQGYESIAVICKTQREAQQVYAQLKGLADINLLSSEDSSLDKGVLVIPSYLAKGLEFDVALVYNVTQENYTSEFDQKLLYVACTRALHRLALYYTGEISPHLAFV
ncbi:MAG: AAA family ATPase [Peptococcaceae bacterium]|nr:AAA family ATPase [Peptococcaceae bacterium]